jgi:polyhydroxyalkanoate synthesis regulator protein
MIQTSQEVFTVLRYPNRKLFIVGTKAYANYTEIADRIRRGEKLVAYDRKTDENITDHVLAQICALETSKGERIYDSELLLKALLSSKAQTRVKIRQTIND